jgi:GNAT superfamily N-acetyltransferase
MIEGVQIEEGGEVFAGEYRSLRDAIGWRPVDAPDEEVQAALGLTFNVTARKDDGLLVGLVRLLDDGLMYTSVWDMIVHPTYQHLGIGRELFDRVLARTRERHLVALVATAAGEQMYRSRGFSEESLGSTALFVRPVESSGTTSVV